MNGLTKLQKNFIVNSAVATTAMVLSSTEVESKTETAHDSEESTEKKAVQMSPLQFQKSELKLTKGATLSNHLKLIKSSEQVEDTSIQDIEPAWPKDTMLSLGDRGSKVKTIQQHLHETGYYLSTIDGIFGAKTMEAVQHFQNKQGLISDGIVGEETISRLIGTKITVKNEVKSQQALPPVFQTAVYFPNNNAVHLSNYQGDEEVNYLQYGDQNDEVATLQNQLLKTGYYQGSADGVYGSYTQQAVRTLQRNHSLQLDGLAGEEVESFLETHDLAEIARKQKQKKSRTASKSSETASEEKAQEKSNSETTVATTSTSEAAEKKSETTKTETKAEKETKPETKSETKSENTTVSSSSLIQSARNLIGTPYVWGGTSRSGFDCSGFLQYVFNQTGVNLPRTVAEMWNATTAVGTPAIGDLVFYETYKPGPSHAGIYLGDGKFIHAGSSSGVSISKMNSSYWTQRYLGVRRVSK